jgi:hypothetical protein
MKKLSFFALALALTFFVACKGKDSAEPVEEEITTEAVEGEASGEVSNMEAEEEELTPEEDVFAADLED